MASANAGVVAVQLGHNVLTVVKSGEHAAHLTLGPAEFMSHADDATPTVVLATG